MNKEQNKMDAAVGEWRPTIRIQEKKTMKISGTTKTLWSDRTNDEKRWCGSDCNDKTRQAKGKGAAE